MKKLNLFLALSAILTIGSCVKNNHPEPDMPFDQFEFSTSAEGITLSVEYSNTGVSSPVYFEVYDTCPVVLDEESNSYAKIQGLLPMFSAYTDASGRFTQTISIPSYAKKLYFYAPAFYARTLMEADVNGSVVSVSDDIYASAETKAIATTTQAHYSYMAEDCMKKIPSEYQNVMKPWKCWLGEYDKYANGSISSYLCTREDLLPKDPQNLFLTFHEALHPENNICPEEFRSSEDMYMSVDGPVSVTFLGQNSCFNSSVGYYYYQDGQKPASLAEINAIMLFPNTQDGLWEKSKDGNNDARPSTGIERLSTVQLMYYPEIASGSKEGATEIFPAGIRIGLLQVTNAWSNRLKQNYYVGSRNISATTPGISRANDGTIYGEDVARTALFRVDDNIFLSFEDYKDDQNFTDCVVSINSIPADALKVSKNLKKEDLSITTNETCAVFSFEDLWPYKGDYDLNDVVVRYNHQTSYSNGKKIAEAFLLKTFQNRAANNNGLGLSIAKKGTGYSGDFQSQGAMSCFICKEGSDVFEPIDMVYEPKNIDGNNVAPVYLLTDNVKINMGAEYKLLYTYNYAIEPGNNELSIDIQPFIYRVRDNGKRLEVHITNEKPTFRMDYDLLGQGDDISNPKAGIYFSRKGNYPFALRLDGATIEDISALLDPIYETVPIDVSYPDYKNWVKNKGQVKQDWYKHPAPVADIIKYKNNMN